MMKKYQLKATAKYQKANMTMVTLKFHNKSDLDVINKLQSVENKTDYIRQLILKDIGKA